VQWSPSSARLALVASLETCEPDQPAALPRRTLAYVVDPITGASREVAQSSTGLELEWAGEQLLALATNRGVELVDLSSADGTSELLGSDLSLPMPLRRTRCAEPLASDLPPPPIEEPPPPEDGDAALRPGDTLDDL
jgi:hypothetical protein